MVLKKLGAIIAGLATLWLLFYVLLFTLAALWPQVREVGGRVMESGDYSGLTSTMLLPMLLFWYVSFIAAGMAAMRIAPGKWITIIMVTPHFLLAAWNHLYAMWAQFPAWYNILQVLMIYPLAWLGGRLVQPGQMKKTVT